jgi:hypothetical protein
MVPSVACAISVSSELPEAWLNNQAYQKVTATVAVASIGLEPNWGIRKNGICQMVTPMAISTVVASGVGWLAASAEPSPGSSLPQRAER